MKLIVNQPVKTHIISGFLGAGKTTLLTDLLGQKPEGEVWAVLMNEFGQIGVDQQLLPQSQGFEVKELLGGCLCCSSQLPMQIALSRLLAETRPDRLFIEPTGLGHPAQLLEQLTEPHWQASIAMQSLVTVVDGSRLHDTDWSNQNLYADQLKAAQMIVVSHVDLMQQADQLALDLLKTEYAAYQQTWLMLDHGNICIEQFEQAYVGTARKIQPLLYIQQVQHASEQVEVKQLPYHYVETAQGYSVVGWKFSKRWQFDFLDLLDLLCEQKDWLRIKGVFNTNQGWKTFNFNPAQFNYGGVEESIDNRIEMIYQTQREWVEFEKQLLSCRIDDKT